MYGKGGFTLVELVVVTTIERIRYRVSRLTEPFPP